LFEVVAVTALEIAATPESGTVAYCVKADVEV
jgi:hypothetical protein